MSGIFHTVQALLYAMQLHPVCIEYIGTFITRVIFCGHEMDAARQQLTASAPRQFLPKPVLQAFYPPCDTWFEFVHGLPLAVRHGQWFIEQI